MLGNHPTQNHVRVSPDLPEEAMRSCSPALPLLWGPEEACWAEAGAARHGPGAGRRWELAGSSGSLVSSVTFSTREPLC